MQNGGRVKSVEEWKTKRRPEILELFLENIYGRMPVGRPKDIQFTVTDVDADALEGTAIRKGVTISYSGPGGKGEIHLLLFIPKKAGRKSVPCFLLICNRPKENMDPTRKIRKPFWPVEQIVASGYATATFHNADVAADKFDGFSSGVFPIFTAPGERRPDSWGTIAAWSWGASRAMDYLETDPDIDAASVAIVGQSRGGKAALWAGAEDERFAMVVSNDSGCAGAALARGKSGERIRDINQAFPHWFCENYKRFNDREQELPVDQHMLDALIAPRWLYIASASEDSWADPKSEFRAAVEAGVVYHLFGMKGLESTQMPPTDSPRHNGSIGYHLRTGGHDLTAYDWKQFVDFADKHLSASKKMR